MDEFYKKTNEAQTWRMTLYTIGGPSFGPKEFVLPPVAGQSSSSVGKRQDDVSYL